MTPSKKKKAQQGLMFITKKRDSTIKGRLVYNGKETREWISKEEVTSPTVSLESILLTAVINAKEGQDVMTADIPKTYIQADLHSTPEGQDRVIVKLTGTLADLMVQMAPEVYGPFVVFEHGVKTIYNNVTMGMYGMLVAGLYWYRKFSGDLIEDGYVKNPYDPCMCNKMIESDQHTVEFHVDNMMSGVQAPKHNDKFAEWLNTKYGKHGKVKVTRGKVHDYLGMTLDFSKAGEVAIDMCDYVASMIDDSSFQIGSKTAPTPAAEDLFSVDEDSPLLPTSKREEFHTIVAKGLFICRRARPDIHTAIAAMCTRVQVPTEQDWEKLERLLRYLNGTRQDELILKADNLNECAELVRGCCFCCPP